MDVALTPAGPEQEPVFAQLMQLYYPSLLRMDGHLGSDIEKDVRVQDWPRPLHSHRTVRSRR